MDWGGVFRFVLRRACAGAAGGAAAGAL